ncbi:MAG: TraR/DksA family transcriptional regulator [bacterium]
MTKKQLSRFKKLLIEKRDEMLKDLGQLKDREVASTLKDASGENSAYSFHMADVGTDNMEREKAFFFATREGKFLNHIEEALQRIEDGTYGICSDCHQPIPEERLVAVPTATRCVPCKEKAE